MILRHIPKKDLSRTSQLLLLAAAAVILPISSRLVAQDKTETKEADRRATERPDSDSPKKVLDKARAADEKPKVKIPRAGILEVVITIGEKTTKTKSMKGAATQLRRRARRIAEADTFSTVINVNGTTRELKDPQQALAACNVLAGVLDTMKKSRIQLGALGPIEQIKQPAFNQQVRGQPLPGQRRGRDGDDGLGAGGGLGGQSGGGSFGAAFGQSPPGFGQSGLGGAGGQGGGLGVGGQGGRGGGGSKEQLMARFRYAISQVLFDAKQAKQQQQPKPKTTESSSDGVARSGKAILFSRQAHRSYEKATFSFEFALRDDPTKRIGNDWDLQFGNVPNHFHVTMVSDDRSRIVDLGEMNFEQLDLTQLQKLPAHPRPRRDFVPAVVGHVYLVHTADRNTDLYALFRVEQIAQNRTCNISWKRIEEPGAVIDGQKR